MTLSAPRKHDTGTGALKHDFLTKTEEFRGPPARRGMATCALHKPTLFDDAPKVLLVKPTALKCFNSAL